MLLYISLCRESSRFVSKLDRKKEYRRILDITPTPLSTGGAVPEPPEIGLEPHWLSVLAPQHANA